MIVAWGDDRGMAETVTEVSTNGVVDTKRSSNGSKRRQWTRALKRRIVAETLEPGASVSIVARRHDVNANQVFKSAARDGAEAAGRGEAKRHHAAGGDRAGSERAAPASPAQRHDRDHVRVRHARVFRGAVSPEMLRQVIELLQ